MSSERGTQRTKTKAQHRLKMGGAERPSQPHQSKGTSASTRCKVCARLPVSPRLQMFVWIGAAHVRPKAEPGVYSPGRTHQVAAPTAAPAPPSSPFWCLHPIMSFTACSFVTSITLRCKQTGLRCRQCIPQAPRPAPPALACIAAIADGTCC